MHHKSNNSVTEMKLKTKCKQQIKQNPIRDKIRRYHSQDELYQNQTLPISEQLPKY